MKKNLLMLIFCINLILLSACSSPDNNLNDGIVNESESEGDVTTPKDSDDVTKEDNEDVTKVENESEITVEEQVLFDQDGVLITLKSIDTEDIWGPGLKVEIANDTEKDITVQTNYSSVNGAMTETLFSSDVAAGKKANSTINFETSDLEVAGIEVLKDIELSFIIIDASTWDTLMESETISITTSADENFEQKFDESGFVAFDKNGVKIVVKKLESEDSFWGSDIYVYMKNDSDQDVTIQASNVSINGFMVDPMFSSDIVAGKVSFDTISFLESDLTDNEITNIDNLELQFNILDMESYDTISDSEVVKVSFTD